MAGTDVLFSHCLMCLIIYINLNVNEHDNVSIRLIVSMLNTLLGQIIFKLNKLNYNQLI